MEWMKFKVGDICITNIQTYSDKENWPFINYLDTGNITNNVIDEIQHLQSGKDKYPSRAKRKVQIDDIVYSTVRPNQRHFGIIKDMPMNFLVSTGFTVITAKKEIVDSDFIYYYLTQNDIIESLHAIGEQSTSAYPSIKPSDIESVEILLPSLGEQRMIAGMLRSLDEKIALNKKINHNLAA